jgi:hypothetical protein
MMSTVVSVIEDDMTEWGFHNLSICNPATSSQFKASVKLCNEHLCDNNL